MKTIALLVLGCVLFPTSIFSQSSKSTLNNLKNYNIQEPTFKYARIDVFDKKGRNLHDFVFSYDVVNGKHTCSNNFLVVSNLNDNAYFAFSIYFDGNWVYSGKVAVPALGNFYFDNAFMNCNSASSKITIVIDG